MVTTAGGAIFSKIGKSALFGDKMCMNGVFLLIHKSTQKPIIECSTEGNLLNFLYFKAFLWQKREKYPVPLTIALLIL